MKIVFLYSPDREYDNFKRSFFSVNHKQASPRQQEFYGKYSDLTRENALAFCENYLRENNISIADRLIEIDKQWRKVETEYFKRADQIFNTSLPSVTIKAYLTIHDRCSYNFEKNEFFIHLNLPATNKTIMHELWHWYFYHTIGQRIEAEKGKKIFNDVKESLTVLLNAIYPDLLAGVTDKGYPQHAELRELILREYEKTHDIYLAIDSAVENCD